MKLNRDWRLFLTILGGIATVCVPAVFLFPSYRNLVVLFLCSIPTNSVVGLPNEPITVLFGRYYVPHLVAIVAALGAVVPCFLDYKAINFAFEAKRLRRIRESDVYQGACQYFLKAPFAVIFTAALVPIIPFYIFRVLSPTAGYPLRRYMPAVFLGRMPRYYLFALMGTTFGTPDLIIFGACLVLLCLFFYRRVKDHLAEHSRPAEAQEPAGIFLNDLASSDARYSRLP